MNWLAEPKRIQELQKLLDDGKRYKDIAVIFNTSISSVKHAAQAYCNRKITPSIATGSRPQAPQPHEALDVETLDTMKEQFKLHWTVPKSTKTLKTKAFKSYLVVADIHVPQVNSAAVKSILKLMDDVPFDGFIILGDYMDMEPISHWLQDKGQHKSLENKRMLTDYVMGNALLDEFDKRLPKNCDKRYFYGNHERFYYDLIERLPALEGLLDPQEKLRLKERSYKVYDKINHIERIGRLSFTHGMYHGENYLKKHIDEFKTNVIHADIHSPRFQLSPSPAREVAISGDCVGCLCDLNPIYMNNRCNKWSHGFAVVHFFENGCFDVDNKRIVYGKFVYNNKLYNGNK
jgi:predicted phosphodiesterase